LPLGADRGGEDEGERDAQGKPEEFAKVDGVKHRHRVRQMRPGFAPRSHAVTIFAQGTQFEWRGGQKNLAVGGQATRRREAPAPTVARQPRVSRAA
jgi:hypothetical protein